MSKAALAILIGAMGFNILVDMVSMRAAPPVDVSLHWGEQ
jgi:hypothetical protein